MLTLTTLACPGSPLPQNNPLPFFKEPKRDVPVPTDASLLPQDMELLGYETAPRYLPYQLQDSYARAKEPRVFKAIVLENEYLKATFLPEYGGRLYSLYHKALGRELLFKNPVIQPANLAILDAWVSGGIEWNVGQYGHAFTTSSPVHCAAVTGEGGEEFLRIYEYERVHGIYWQIDFHLPAGCPFLKAYFRIINDGSEETSLYYWTNIAAQEGPKTRIFSGTDQTIYLDMETGKIGRALMPYLPAMPDKDASFPQNFQYSNEYFFQLPAQDPAPWEAAVYPENWMLFERSTAALRYRKMFCWGSHVGGNRWKDYLSEPGKGSYVEIQAGLAPTQRHGLRLPGHTSVEFVQCFGGAACDAAPLIGEEWHRAQGLVWQQLDNLIPPGFINAQLHQLGSYKNKQPHKILCLGSGFGALENARRQKAGQYPGPAGLPFGEESCGKEQLAWLGLLNNGAMPLQPVGEYPASYMVQPQWRQLLLQSLQAPQGQNWVAYLHYGVMLLEDARYQEAETALGYSIQLCPNPVAYRNLAWLAQKQQNFEKAQQLYRQALGLTAPEEQEPVLREYLALLLAQGQYGALWQAYTEAPAKVRAEERIALLAMQAALELGNLAFVEEVLQGEFIYVRESSTVLPDSWLRLHQIQEQQATGREYTLLEIEAKHPVPARLDFRMKKPVLPPVE